MIQLQLSISFLFLLVTIQFVNWCTANNGASQQVVPAEFNEIIHSSVSSRDDGLLRYKYDLTNAVRNFFGLDGFMLD